MGLSELRSTIVAVIWLWLASASPVQAADVAILGAPSTSSWNADVQAKVAATGLFTQVDTFNVASATPSLAELLNYDAILVYSDTGFQDNVAIGDVLADYMDQGGGVVVCTFVFWDQYGLGLRGRIKSQGYLPFTQASQSQGARLSLVKDIPNDPILSGVDTLDGGSASYHNASITTTAGSTLVAHWSNGQPLVATKATSGRRIVGLNFYPPSTDSRGDFWVASTDGGRLMGNALLWAAAGDCGNGAIDPGEACDDADTSSGDGCSDQCQLEGGFNCAGAPSACSAVCGDGLILGGENCDDGNVASGDGCSALCAVETGYDGCTGAPSVCTPTCGDSLVVFGEPCDDGDFVPGDGCSATCTLEPGYTCSGAPSVCSATCGDGIPAGLEECDDGNLVDDDGCSDNCVEEETFTCSGAPSVCSTDCGNGSVDVGETCDDGARVNGDGCSKVCQVDTGWGCTGAPSSCAPICGDGLIIGGEECDDGNTDAGDCCSSNCVFEPGNAACLAGGEAAVVTGWFAGPTSHLTAGWEFRVHSDLTVTSVGVYDCDDDGLAQNHEVGVWDKDAGPLLIATFTVPAGTGTELVDHFRHVTVPPLDLDADKTYVVAALYPQASTDCVAFSGTFNFDPRITFITGREMSSPTPVLTYPGSPNTYRFGPTFLFASLRGDGVVDGGEQCDDGNVANGDGCTSNGEIEPGYGCAGAPSLCATTCGDGVIAGAEECDDGDAAGGDGCSATCSLESTYTCLGQPSVCTNSCGDGVIDGGEECDDGDLSADDGCSTDCQVEASYACTGTPSLCTTNCGNAVIDNGTEQCDDGNLVDGDCCSKSCLFEPANAACWKSMPVPSGGMGSGGVGVVEGWEFTVGSTVTIAALGVFDEPSSAGLAEEHPVAIWDSAQQMLATATVPPGTAAQLIGGFRYVPIGGLTLSPGTYTIGAYFPPPRNDSVIGAPAPALDPRLTLVTGRRLPFVASLVFPTTLDTNARVGPGLLLEITGCGDGGPDAGEQCDDGNLTAGDCCSIECQIFAGTCSDGQACTTADTCQAGACVGGPLLDCDDGNACTQDSCNPGSGLCVNDATPLASCKDPGRTTLLVKDHGTDSKDKVVWKWLKGDTGLAEFGNPVASTEYGLCLFDESGGVPNPIFDLEIGAGANWSAVGTTGFNYKDTSALQDGAFKVVLRAGTPDKAKAIFIAKGANLNWSGTPLPFDQDARVRVQLHNSAGECWESEFTAPAIKNQIDLFKDRQP